MKTRLERQRTNPLLELLDHAEAARCRMEGCRVCLLIAKQARDVLTTVQMANAINGGPTDRIARPHPTRRVPSSSPPGGVWRARPTPTVDGRHAPQARLNLGRPTRRLVLYQP